MIGIYNHLTSYSEKRGERAKPPVVALRSHQSAPTSPFPPPTHTHTPHTHNHSPQPPPQTPSPPTHTQTRTPHPPMGPPSSPSPATVGFLRHCPQCVGNGQKRRPAREPVPQRQLARLRALAFLTTQLGATTAATRRARALRYMPPAALSRASFARAQFLASAGRRGFPT